MSKGLHHITEYLLTCYLEEVERQMEEGNDDRVIINIPIAVEMKGGKYTTVIAPSNEKILECLNNEFEENVDVEFTVWEREEK